MLPIEFSLLTVVVQKLLFSRNNLFFTNELYLQTMFTNYNNMHKYIKYFKHNKNSTSLPQ